MPEYLVKNKLTNDSCIVQAPYARVACEMLGWLIEDCSVEILIEGPFTDISRKPALILSRGR